MQTTPSSKPAVRADLRASETTPQKPTSRSFSQRLGGQLLDHKTQNEMSAQFGHDFSQVRIHTDRDAQQSAHALGANAYAHGSDIIFGTGKYTPGSPETERLLAHELTHVVQQERWGGGDWGRQSHRGDASEREADSLASQVMLGRSVQAQAAPQAAIARDENDGDPNGMCPTPDWSPTPQTPSVLSPAAPTAPASGYHGDYPWSTPTVDAASSSAWDIGGMIPGIGTIVNGAGLAIDMGKAGIDSALGDSEGAQTHMNNAGQDALGMIPGVGTVMGYGNLMVDGAATGNRLAGGNMPTSSELFDQGMRTGPSHYEDGGQEGAGAM